MTSTTTAHAQISSGIDPSSISSVIRTADDLFRYLNGPWIDTYNLPDDRSRFGSFDRLAENAEQQIRDILEASGDEAAKSKALYASFLDTDAAATKPPNRRRCMLHSSIPMLWKRPAWSRSETI